MSTEQLMLIPKSIPTKTIYAWNGKKVVLNRWIDKHGTRYRVQAGDLTLGWVQWDPDKTTRWAATRKTTNWQEDEDNGIFEAGFYSRYDAVIWVVYGVRI
jgi:hypothetical protein